MSIKLHLGCFDQPVEGWVNTDITPHIHVARVPGLAWLLHKTGKMTAERYQQHREGVFRKVRYLDLTKPLPYTDGSVAAIYCSHTLEHLFPDETEGVLRECHRVLERGGICRIVVPDLDWIMRLYRTEDPAPFLSALFAVTSRGHHKNAHHWGFSAHSLSQLLRRCGFSRVDVCGYRQGRCPNLESLDKRPEDSIHLEGQK